MWIGGRHVYGLEEKKPRRGEQGRPYGLVQVYDVDGKKLAENALPIPAEYSAEKRQRIIEKNGGPGWGFSYSCPFIVHGDRLYARSNDQLFCIGEK